MRLNVIGLYSNERTYYKVLLSMHIRKAKYAGILYPSDPDVLSVQLAELLLLTKAEHLIARALVVPFGEASLENVAAASAYRCLQYNCQVIKRVVFIYESAQLSECQCAMPQMDAFESPLGAVNIDRETANIMTSSADCIVDDAYFGDSLLLEMHLPFLQLCLVNFTILPIIINSLSGPALSTLLNYFLSHQDTLVVFCSNLENQQVNSLSISSEFTLDSSVLNIFDQTLRRHSLIPSILNTQRVIDDLDETVKEVCSVVYCLTNSD